MRNENLFSNSDLSLKNVARRIENEYFARGIKKRKGELYSLT